MRASTITSVTAERCSGRGAPPSLEASPPPDALPPTSAGGDSVAFKFVIKAAGPHGLPRWADSSWDQAVFSSCRRRENALQAKFQRLQRVTATIWKAASAHVATGAWPRVFETGAAAAGLSPGASASVRRPHGRWVREDARPVSQNPTHACHTIMRLPRIAIAAAS